MAIWIMLFSGFNALMPNDPGTYQTAQARLQTKPVPSLPSNVPHSSELSNAANLVQHINNGDTNGIKDDLQAYGLDKLTDYAGVTVAWMKWAMDAGVWTGEQALKAQHNEVYQAYKKLRQTTYGDPPRHFTPQDILYARTHPWLSLPEKYDPIKTGWPVSTANEILVSFGNDDRKMVTALEGMYQFELYATKHSGVVQQTTLQHTTSTFQTFIHYFAEYLHDGWNHWFPPKPGKDHPDDNYDLSSIRVSREKSLFNAYKRLAYEKDPAVFLEMDYIEGLCQTDRDVMMTNWKPDVWAMAKDLDTLYAGSMADIIDALPQEAVNVTESFKMTLSVKDFGIQTGMDIPDMEVHPFSLKLLKETVTKNPSLLTSILDCYSQGIDRILNLPRVAVLRRGSWNSLGGMLSEFSEPVRYVGADFDVANISLCPVFIIPSGGLFGLDSSPSFKSKLESYLGGGGTLIVLDQQYGKDFRAVPGGISGYGWIEDQSCQYSSVAITTYTPAFSSQAKTAPDINVDGYFTGWPGNSTILLSRTKNAMPAMLMYNYSKGRVIACTAYEDFAYGDYAVSQAGKQLIRDTVSWALMLSKKMPEYAPGSGSIVIPVSVTNIGNSTGTIAVFQTLEPDRNIIETIEQPVSIRAGETKRVDMSIKAPSTAGIWWVDYTLRNASGGQVSRKFDAQGFSISQYKANPGGFAYQFSGMLFDITSETEELVSGQDINFTIHLYNNDDSAQNISITYDWSHQAFDTNVVTVPAKGQLDINYTRKNAESGRFWCFFIDSSGRMLGSASKGISVLVPSLSFEMGTDKNAYGENEQVRSTVTVRSNIGLPAVRVTLSAVDPAGGVSWSQSRDISLDAATPITGVYNFTLSRTSLSGSYLLSARCDYYNYVDMGSSRFDYSGGNGTLSGRVVDWITNSSIPNANLRIEGLGKVLAGQSDAGGNFSFDTQGGLYKLHVLAEGYNYARVTVPVYAHTQNKKDPFTTQTGVDSRNLGLQGVRGRVLTIVGETPVAGASVWVSFSDVEIFTESDPNGEYYLTFPAGRCEVGAGIGGISSAFGEVDVFSGRTTIVDLYVDAAVQTGTVRDIVYQNVIPGAKLSFDGINNITTDGAGRYSITLQVGSHIVAVSAQNYSRVDTSLWVMYRNSDNDFYLFPTNNWTTGTVRDLIFNRTLAGANVSFDGKFNATTDKDGQYRVLLSTGYHSVTVGAGDHETIITGIFLAGRSTTYDFFLIPLTATASGIVRDLIYDSPIAGASVSIDSAINTTTDANGTFSVPTYAGYHTVSLRHPEFSDQTTGIYVAQRSDSFDFYLEPPATNMSFANGTVRDLVYDIPLKSVNVSFDGNINVSTDGNGFFTRVLTTGFHSVALSLSGYDSMTTGIHLGGRSSPYEIYMTPNTRTFGGIVRDINETATIAGAALTFDGTTNVITDASGNYSVKLSTGLHDVTIAKVGFGTLSTTVQATPSTTAWNFLLTPSGYTPPQPQGTLTLRVHDVVNGGPAVNVPVWYDGLDRGTTDANGTYVLTYGTGTFRLILRENNTYWGFDTWGRTGLTVYPGRNMTLDFYLMPMNGSIKGTVFDEVSGLPAPGITVWYDGWDRNVTNANGSYYMPYSSGIYRLLLRQNDEYDGIDTWGHDGITVFAGKTVTMDFYIPPRKGFLTGKVFNVITGLPVQGITVWYDGWDRTTTDANGSYSFRYWAGVYRMLLRQTDEFEGIDTWGHDGITVYRGRTASADYYLMPRKGDLTGKVYDTIFGMPLPNITVWYDGWDRVVTDANGTYAFRYWGGVSRTMLRQTDEYDSVDTWGHDGIMVYSGIQTTMDFFLEPRKGNLSGTVYDALTGEPLSGITVWYDGWDRNVTDTNGTYSIRYLSGDYRTLLRSTELYDGFDTWGHGGLRVNRGTDTRLDFHLVPKSLSGMGKMTGKVRDLLTAEPLDAMLTIGALTISTDDNGTYSMMLPAGTTDVRVTCAGYQNLSARIGVPRIRTTVHDFHVSLLNGTGILNCTVIDKGNNRTVAGAQISLYSGFPEPVMFNTTTDGDGSFSLPLPSRAYAMAVNATGYSAFDQNVTVFADRQVVRKIYVERSGAGGVLPAELELVSIPHKARFFIGELATFTVRMRNIGDLVGKAQVDFSMPGVYQKLGIGWIAPGAEGDVIFNFTVPDDLEEKEYKVFYGILGKKYEQSVKIVGMKVEVTASLDKRMYLDNDTASLTMIVTNLKTFNASLFSRVKYNGFDESRQFNLSALGMDTLTFNVPVTGPARDKLFYSVYISSGRSLYINALYLYRKPAQDVVLSADKQVYKMGETVNLNLESNARGVVKVTTPWYIGLIDLNNTKTANIPVPELPSGTYMILYEFGNFSGTYPIDVDGYSARVVDAELQKGSYEVGDAVNITLNLEANRDVNGTLTLTLYDPQMNLVGTSDSRWTLHKGENNAAFTVRFNSSQQTGIHSVMYAFEADLRPDPYELVGGVKAFDGTDKTSPRILNLTTSDIMHNSVTIIVKTDEKTIVQVEYGPTGTFGRTVNVSYPGKLHSVTLANLDAEKIYHYKVKVTDMSGNTARSNEYQVKTKAKPTETSKSSLIPLAVICALLICLLLLMMFGATGGRKTLPVTSGGEPDTH
jgi:hypothetical protein